ncbi:MAG: type II toxin-antitoxin system VapC family toxin [Terriglobales bacterium]
MTEYRRLARHGAQVAQRGQMRGYVLDANALIGFFEGRSGVAEKVRHLLGEALRYDSALLMSSVNWGEVFYLAWKHHGETKAYETESKLEQLRIVVVGVDRARATRAAALKQKHALGYADAFAAELAIERNAWLVTADPDFSRIGKALRVFALPRHV